jgi:hypothetical protein
METFIIRDLHSLPEFKSIPPDEFKHILEDYHAEFFKNWHTWVEIAIRILFISFGDFLYDSLKPSNVAFSILWWLATVLACGVLGFMIENQVKAHATRRRLKKFIQKRNAAKDLELTESETKLYETLRRVRVNIAVPKGITSSKICDDRVLQEMAKLRPTQLGILNRIPGAKIEFIKTYGKIFVDEISMYEDRNRSLQ